MKPDPKTTAGRAFLKSLNILLKYARMYGFEHTRTIEQLWIAFEELLTAIPADSAGGLLLGAASGSRLLLDGVPQEGAAERQLAQLLSVAGLASVQFFPTITQAELARFARAFPVGRAKPSELAKELKAALAGASGIRINEIFFVAADSRFKESSIAAQLANASLGSDQEHAKEWLNDPRKLLELIAAAQGSKTASAQEAMRLALTTLAARAPQGKADEYVLVQLAEHLAIRFALERFERGEVKVNAVRQLLDRMHQEIDSLRKVLGEHENKMSEAGMLFESHRELLDRQFWAAVPERGKHQILLSHEAWCVPPHNVRSYVRERITKGDMVEGISILMNYAACVGSENPEARKKTATGLAELAELYANADPQLLKVALRHVGLRLGVEQDGEIQGLMSATFIRLSQQAVSCRHFPALGQALDLLTSIEAQRPGSGSSLLPKMGIEERIPEFVDEALRARQIVAGLSKVLKMLPQTTMEHLAIRFNRCSLRDESEHLANLAADLGEEAVQYLRSAVRGGPVKEAAEMAGLLSRLDPKCLMVFLPGRMKDFSGAAQDRLVRQISASGAARKCHILMELLDRVDPLILPLVIDEIGMTGDREALGRLLTIAEGDLPNDGREFLRVKAIEALGRIHAPETLTTLKRMVESRSMFTWAYPQELRIAAMQALEKLDPEWVQSFWSKSGIHQEDLMLAPLEVPLPSEFVRQRRHQRVRLRKPLRAISMNLKENCRLEIKTASLSGGLATISRHLPPGTPVQLRWQVGMRQMQATALMRDYRAPDMAFEIVDMDLAERSKYRRLLAGNLPQNQSLAESIEAQAETVVTQ
jgi:hypothetical protein